MANNQFRCAFFAQGYESTVAFYRDGLELPVVETWDRGRDDRGTLFRAAFGILQTGRQPTCTGNYNRVRTVANHAIVQAHPVLHRDVPVANLKCALATAGRDQGGSQHGHGNECSEPCSGNLHAPPF